MGKFEMLGQVTLETSSSQRCLAGLAGQMGSHQGERAHRERSRSTSRPVPASVPACLLPCFLACLSALGALGLGLRRGLTPSRPQPLESWEKVLHAMPGASGKRETAQEQVPKLGEL